MNKKELKNYLNDLIADYNSITVYDEYDEEHKDDLYFEIKRVKELLKEEK